jgi:hypothetical protein
MDKYRIIPWILPIKMHIVQSDRESRLYLLHLDTSQKLQLNATDHERLS